MLSFHSKTYPQYLRGNVPWTLGGQRTYYSYARNADKLREHFPCEGEFCNPGFRRAFDDLGRPYMAAFCFHHMALLPAQDYTFLAHMWTWKLQKDGLILPNPGPYNRQWFGEVTVHEDKLARCHLCNLSFLQAKDVRRHVKEDHFESDR